MNARRLSSAVFGHPLSEGRVGNEAVGLIDCATQSALSPRRNGRCPPMSPIVTRRMAVGVQESWVSPMHAPTRPTEKTTFLEHSKQASTLTMTPVPFIYPHARSHCDECVTLRPVVTCITGCQSTHPRRVQRPRCRYGQLCHRLHLRCDQS